MEWDQVVEKISVSSNNSQLPALIDHSTTTYWQSSGQQNKVNCVMYVQACICVCVCIRMFVCVHMHACGHTLLLLFRYSTG